MEAMEAMYNITGFLAADRSAPRLRDERLHLHPKSLIRTRLNFR